MKTDGNKTIDYRFKLLYAIGAILVVEGHFGGSGVNFFANWFPIYSFHLAMFMFASGYFYDSNSEKAPLQYIGKKIKSLLVPLYLWNFFYAAVVFVTHKAGFSIGEPVSFETVFLAPVYDGHQFAYNMGGWFIIPLFMVQVYNVLFRKIVSVIVKEKNEILLFLFHLILGMFGVYLASVGFHEDWWRVLVRMLYFIPFYNLGILYKSKLEYWDRRIPNLLYFAVVLSIQWVIILIYGEAPSYVPSWCRDFDNGVILPFVAGTLGIAFWFRIAVMLEPVIGKSRAVNAIADNAYSIMINQFMGAMAFKFIFYMIQRQTSFCADFDKDSFRSNVWYKYNPGGVEQTFLFYIAAGIIVPIMMQHGVNLVWKLGKSRKK